MKVPFTRKTTLRLGSHPADGTSAGKDLAGDAAGARCDGRVPWSWHGATQQAGQDGAVGGAVCCRLNLPSLDGVPMSNQRNSCIRDEESGAHRVVVHAISLAYNMTAYSMYMRPVVPNEWRSCI